MHNTKHAKFIIAVQEATDRALDQSVLLSLVSHNCLRSYRAIRPVFDQRMGQYELRQVEFSVLSLLKANPNINQKRVSGAISVAPPDLAILLDRLEARGLVLRQRNPLDKRSQTLSLTADGLRLCEQAEDSARKLEVEATPMLSEDEREQLIRLLQKIFLRGSE
jgi:DNA-binding MarR family transcriptional regulator